MLPLGLALPTCLPEMRDGRSRESSEAASDVGSTSPFLPLRPTTARTITALYSSGTLIALSRPRTRRRQRSGTWRLMGRLLRDKKNNLSRGEQELERGEQNTTLYTHYDSGVLGSCVPAFFSSLSFPLLTRSPFQTFFRISLSSLGIFRYSLCSSACSLDNCAIACSETQSLYFLAGEPGHCTMNGW